MIAGKLRVQIVGTGEIHQRQRRVQPELLEDTALVGADGFGAEVHLLRNIHHPRPARQMLQHLQLTVRECSDQVGFRRHLRLQPAAGAAPEMVWLLEHPPLYTAGTSAEPGDLIDPNRFPVFQSGRGGQFTYHGPGQRVAYVMLDLTRRARDVRLFVTSLETWIVNTLKRLGVSSTVHRDRVGVWVVPREGAAEEKVAAIGVRLRKWISFHGISINLCPDLEHFSGIVPCGLANYGVTSLEALGSDVTLDVLDTLLREEFEALFGPTQDVATIAEAARSLTRTP